MYECAYSKVRSQAGIESVRDDDDFDSAFISLFRNSFGE